MKLRYLIIEKLHTLTRRELHLLLYACRIQDDATGRVEGLYYKDVMKHTGMCKQSVYNALRGLEAKGIILITGHTDVDCNICIIDNACPDAAARAEGYVNLNREAFRKAAFWKLKAHEIYMLLEFLKCTHEGSGSMVITVKRLYQKFGAILGVTGRVIRSYLHSLRQFFSIGIKDGKYYITYLHSVFRKPKDEKTEPEVYREQIVRKECHRSRTEYSEQELADTAGLLKQYPKSRYPDVKAALMQCIRHSVEGLRRKDRRLNVKYIHRLLRRALDLPEKAYQSQEAEQEPDNEGNVYNAPVPV